MAGLLDFWGTPQPGPDGRDPVLSLLAPFVTGGAIAPSGPTPEGAEPWSVPPDSRAATMAGWSAFNQALLRAGEKTLGPPQSTAGAVADALAAGSGAAGAQQRTDWLQRRQEFAMGLQLRDQQRKEAGLRLAFGAFMPAGTGQIAPDGSALPGAAPGGAPGGGEDYPGASVRDLLSRRESGGQADQVNGLRFSGEYQLGAPLAATAGIYQPGPQENVSDPTAPGQWSGVKWSGTFNIPGFPQVKTVGDFLANRDAQQAAYKAGMAANDQALNRLGLYGYVGQTIGGVPVTRDGLLAAAWLGGPAGVERFVRSGGTDNRADGNGTKVSDYLAMGVAARPDRPPPNLTPDQQSTWQKMTPQGRQAVMATMIADPDKGIAMLAQSAIQDANRDRFVVLTPAQARARGITDTSRTYQLNTTTQKVEAMPDTPASYRVLTPAEVTARGLSTNQRWQVNERDNQVSALPDQPQKRILSDTEAQQRMGPGYRPGSTYIETVGPDGTTRDVQTMVIADRAGLVPNEPQAVRLAADLSHNLAQDPRLRQWRETEPRFDGALVGLNENTRAGAEAAIESVAKIFDPNAVVRDHKLEMAAAYGGMQQRLSEFLGRTTGESGLTEDAKRQLASLAYNDMKARDQAALAALREAREAAVRQGLDPGMVLPKLKLIALQPHEVEGELPAGVTFRAPMVETPNGRFELSDRKDGKPVVPAGQLRPDALSPDAPPALRHPSSATPAAAPPAPAASPATPLPTLAQTPPVAVPAPASAAPAPATPPPAAVVATAITADGLAALDAAAFADLRKRARDQRPDFTDAELRLIDAEQRRRRGRN